jgi:hypothetical protein
VTYRVPRGNLRVAGSKIWSKLGLTDRILGYKLSFSLIPSRTVGIPCAKPHDKSLENGLASSDRAPGENWYEYPPQVEALLEIGYIEHLEQGVFMRIEELCIQILDLWMAVCSKEGPKTRC